MEGDVITMQEIYRFTQTGIGGDGAVKGFFRATGVRPKFMDRLKAYGVAVPEDTFDPVADLRVTSWTSPLQSL